MSFHRQRLNVAKELLFNCYLIPATRINSFKMFLMAKIIDILKVLQPGVKINHCHLDEHKKFIATCTFILSFDDNLYRIYLSDGKRSYSCNIILVVVHFFMRI